MSEEFFLSSDYEILEKVAQGAMGVIYRARTMDNTEVAIKTLAQDISQKNEFQELFLREMKVAGQLDSPYIVKAYDFGLQLENDLFFVVFEYIDGETLDDLLEREGKLDLERALKITQQVSRGLEHADELDYVHRDIKPENLMIDKSGRVKIADFGLVKIKHSPSSASKQDFLMGTPLYVSPEQVQQDDDVDIRADIYGLGVTLFHMLAGRPPFVFEDPIQAALAHVNTPMPSIYDFHPDLPSSIGRLIEYMTAKDRDLRISTPRDLGCIIEEILRDPNRGNYPVLPWEEEDTGFSLS